MTLSLTGILDPATKHEAVLDLLGDAFVRNGRSEAEICLSLYRAFRDNVHRRYGAARFEDFIARRYDEKERLTSVRKFIGSRIASLPLTLAALDKGELSYTKVREFVSLANPDDEGEWVEYAKSHTNRELERRVRKKQEADGTATTMVVSWVTAEERQAARRAREILSKRNGHGIPPSRLYGEMARAIAGGILEELSAAGNGKPKKPPVYVSIQPCPICLDSFVPTPAGLLRSPMLDWVKAVKAGADILDLTSHFFCDCEETKHRKDRCSNWKREEAAPPKSRYVPAEVEKVIRARDGFVCRVPGCRNEVALEKSHLVPFRDGTPPLPSFLREHCGTCNDLIESECIQVLGTAPYERYYDRGGTFLGIGYDMEPRKEEAGSAHVGRSCHTSQTAPETGPERPPEGPERTPDGPETA